MCNGAQRSTYGELYSSRGIRDRGTEREDRPHRGYPPATTREMFSIPGEGKTRPLRARWCEAQRLSICGVQFVHRTHRYEILAPSKQFQRCLRKGHGRGFPCITAGSGGRGRGFNKYRRILQQPPHQWGLGGRCLRGAGESEASGYSNAFPHPIQEINPLLTRCVLHPERRATTRRIAPKRA